MIRGKSREPKSRKQKSFFKDLSPTTRGKKFRGRGRKDMKHFVAKPTSQTENARP